MQETNSIQGEDMSQLLTQKKIEIMVNIAMKGMVQEIDNLKNQVKHLESEISLLKDELKNRKYAGSFAEAPATAAGQAEPQKTMASYAPEQKSRLVTVGAGDYKEQLNPADFAVEKIFYSGSGRR